MIAFGLTVTEPAAYHQYARPGIRGAAEPDSEEFVFSAVGPVARGYNLLLDTAATRENLEALVLVHPHAQIDDPDFCHKVRQALSDPEVGVVGCAGASGASTLGWWEGTVSSGPVTHRYQEHGGGEMPAYGWTTPAPAPAEVDSIDGFLIVVSPWAVRNVRFDESLGMGLGFDVDFCHQVRAAGRKVVTAGIRMIHHHGLELIEEETPWVEAHVQLAEKWDTELAEANEDADGWKRRARRAEAEREAARAITYGQVLHSDARLLMLERAMEEVSKSLSWRITAPLRQASATLRRRRQTSRQPDSTRLISSLDSST